MRVTGLMIGDWVNINGINLKVGAIHADEIGVFDPDYKIYWCSDDGLDRVDPIPLTEDILEKNGFERHPLWHHCTLEVGDGSQIYIPLACGGGIEYVSIYKHFEDLTVRDIDIQIPIHNVHELQHLLRLCGIEKEISI